MEKLRIFSVCMHPQRSGSCYGHLCGGMGIDAFDKIMFAEKGSGQGQQNQSLGNIAYGTEIQYPVMIDSGRAEHETAALVTVTHTDGEVTRKSRGFRVECLPGAIRMITP